MLVIGRTFRLVHAVYRKLFLNFLHTWCLCTLGHISRIQIVCPFLNGVLRHTVEVVHLHYIILGIKVAYYINVEFLLLERTQFKQVSIVYATELCLAVINDVRPLAQREIHDVHTVHLTHVLVSFTFLDIFRNKFRRAEQHTLEVSIFRIVLHLNQEQFTLVVLCKHIHSVILVRLIILIAFTLKHPLDLDLHAKQSSKQTLKDSEVCFLSEQSFHRPVKPYVFVLVHNSLMLI